MKKILLLAVAAAGIFAVAKRAKSAREERDLWKEATNPAQPTPQQLT